MADLTNTVRWIRYEPDLFGNRKLEAPFWLELNGSLSKEQLRSLGEELSRPVPLPAPLATDATDEQRTARATEIREVTAKQVAGYLKPYIRFGNEPLVINAERIETLEHYLDFTLATFPDQSAFIEPSRALRDANTLGTTTTFFSGRLSGGFVSTSTRGNAPGNGQTVAR